MNNKKIDILDPSGVLIRQHTWSASCLRKFSLMNEDSVTLRFSTHDAMKFPVGSSVGDFFITQEQVGKWNESTGVWEYELKFDAYYWLWENKILRYIISDTNGNVLSALETSFTLTATIDVHANVILNCLKCLGIKYEGSPFRIDTNDTSLSQEAKLVRYENLSVLGGIQAIAEAFGCEWWVIGNAIYFGRCENDDSNHVFEAGINTSSISFQQAKSEAPNRLYVYGSDRNLPTNYRDVDGNDTIGGVVAKRLMLPEGTPYLQTNTDIPENQIVEKVVVLDSVYPRTDLTVSEEPETYISTAEDEDGNQASETYYRLKYGNSFLFSKSYVLPNEELHIVFQSGLLNGMDFGVKFNPKGLNEKNTDGSWNPDAQMFEVVVNEDYGRRLPDGVLKPQKNDKFILYGWDSTKMADLGLITEAEQELLEEGEKALEEYTKDLSTCTCPMAWDYMKPLFANNTQPKPGDVVTIIDTAHFGKGGRKSRIIGFEYKIDKPYAECTYTCGENVSVKRLDSIEKKIDGLTKSGTKVQMQNSLDFLSKRYSDRTPYKLSSDEGFEVGDYVAGASGAIVGKDAETGQTFGEMDRLFIRIKAYFETLTIINAETLAGKQYITPGGSVKITSVEEARNAQGTLTGWKCYFLSEQDGEKTETKMIAGDQAISEMFNAKTGTSNKVSNHRYWRLVTAVEQDAYADESGNHYGYIELSASNCEAGSDEPEAGDALCQLGWQGAGNADRKTAMVFSTVDADAPSIKMFSGIDSYSLADKAIISFGRDPITNKVYFRLGNSSATQYLHYTQDGGLKVAGSITTTSTIGDKTLEEYIGGLIPDIAQEDIEGYVNAILDPKIEGIQNQIDGVIESFFGFGAPTLTNYPANEWTTDGERKAHNRDTYTDKTEYVDDETTPTAGHSWRWQYTSPSDYGWVKISDSDATRALLDAARAQDTADGKRRTFDTTPTPPYDKGDMWVNAVYPAGTTKETRGPANGKYYGDILRCSTPKAEGEQFAIGDWGLASNYTDDTALNDFIAQYTPEIEKIKTQLDSKAQTWYQATDPSTAWDTAALKALHVGDLWYCTVDLTSGGKTYEKGSTWYWNGTAWEEQKIPDSVFDKIDGKADIFVSKPSSYHANDLWFLEADYTGSNGLGFPRKDYARGTLMVAIQGSDTFNALHWAKRDRYTDDTLAQSAKDEIAGYEYLKEALRGNTLINGGLVLSSHIKLGTWTGDGDKATMTKVYAGLNGVYTNTRSPFLWGGGDMRDRFFNSDGTPRTSDPTDYAKALIRMDGSAYFSGGNVLFNTDGSGSVAGGNIAWNALGAVTVGTGVKFDVTNVNGLADTLSSLNSFVNGLNQLFVAVENDANRTEHDIAWASITANQSKLFAIKAKKGFYSESFITAHGIGSSSGGASGGGASELRYLSDVLINSSTLESGQALVYDGTHWVNQTIDTVLGEYLAVNDYARKSDLSPYLKTDGSNGTAAGLSALVRKLSEASGDVTDITLLVTSDNAGDGGSSQYYRRPASKLWNYVKGKADTVYQPIGSYYTKTEADGRFLGISANAASATKLSDDSSFTAWGQEFFADGKPKTVSGDMTGVGSINTYLASISGSGNARLNISGVTATTDYIHLYVDGSGSNTRPLVLQDGYGYVGVGTSTPAYKLDVAGSIHTTDALSFANGKISGVSETYLQVLKGTAAHGLAAGGLLVSNSYSDYSKVPTNGIYVKGEVISASYNSYRIAYGNYGFFLRNDGSYSYFLLTASGDQYGSFNSLRPLFINNSTGLVTMQNGLKVNSVTIGDCEITWDSSKGGLHFSKGIYSDGYVTAHGAGSSSGGSGGGAFALYTKWSDTPDASDALSGILGKELHTRLSAIEGKTLVQISGDGVMEIGKYIDFHTAGFGTNTAEDLAARISIGSGTGREFILPESGGTLATQGWVTGKGYLTSLPTRLAQYITPALSDGNGFGRIASGSPFVSFVGASSSDCMLITTAYSDAWRGELALDYRSNNMAYRNKNNGTWNDWALVLTNKNIGSYAITSHQSLANYVTLNGDQTVVGSKTHTGYIKMENALFFKNTDRANGIYVSMAADADAIRVYHHNNYTYQKKIVDLDTDGNMELRGQLKIVTNSKYVTISCQNSSFTHYRTDASSGHWFNKDVYVQGNIYAGSGYNQLVWHQGNDGSGSGLDADLLDGKHDGELTAQIMRVNDIRGVNQAPSYFDLRGASFWFNETGMPSAKWYSGLTVKGWADTYASWQICSNSNSGTSADEHLYFRTGINDTWQGWKTIAFTSDNVASATKLADNGSFTAWGQEFFADGKPKTVSGDMTGVGSFTGVGQFKYGSNAETDTNYGKHHRLNLGYHGIDHADFYEKKVNFYNNGGTVLYAQLSYDTAYFAGDVGIGTTSPKSGHAHFRKAILAAKVALKFTDSTDGSGDGMYFQSGVDEPYLSLYKHTNGSWAASTFRFYHDGSFWASMGIWSNGYVSAKGQNTSSDARLKNIVKALSLDIRDIANAPSVEFTWRDDGKSDIGSVAQYWQGIDQRLTPLSHDGWLTLQYGKTALLASISIAKKVMSHDEELRLLRAEVKVLREENKEFRRMIKVLEGDKR